ncbi:type IV pilus modification protein PilV [Cupriavidus basilensis]
MLGVAGLLLNSSRFSQQASYDTVAMQLATEMAERMRANTAVSGVGAAAGALGAQPVVFIDTQTSQLPALTRNPYTTACASFSLLSCAQDTARFDVIEWWNRVAAALPGGRAVICRDTVAYNQTSGFSWGCTAAASGRVDDCADRHQDRVDIAPEQQDAGERRRSRRHEHARPQIVIVATPGTVN